MPPKKSRSSSGSTPRPSVGEVETVRETNLPTPDPKAVQRLIDEAMARAQAKRGIARPSSPRRAWCSMSRLFSARECLYSSWTTSFLTDVMGLFLVTCITVYFTVAGYLFYREVALSGF